MTRRGFTLGEVMVAMLLMGGIFFALASIFPVSLASLKKASHNTAAMNIARENLEVWQRKPFSTLVQTTAPQLSTATDAAGVTYSIVVTVSDSEPIDPNLKVVDVQVVSQDPSNPGTAEDRTCVFNWSNPW